MDPVPLKRTISEYHDGTKKIQGKYVTPMRRQECISRYQSNIKEIYEERVVPESRTTCKKKPSKSPVRNKKPKNHSSTVSARVSPVKLSGSSSSGKCRDVCVRAREASDGTGNTMALTEKLKPQLPETQSKDELDGTLEIGEIQFGDIVISQIIKADQRCRQQ